jgi:hypothetical protein
MKTRQLTDMTFIFMTVCTILFKTHNFYVKVLMVYSCCCQCTYVKTWRVYFRKITKIITNNENINLLQLENVNEIDKCIAFSPLFYNIRLKMMYKFIVYWPITNCIERMLFWKYITILLGFEIKKHMGVLCILGKWHIQLCFGWWYGSSKALLPNKTFCGGFEQSALKQARVIKCIWL